MSYFRTPRVGAFYFMPQKPMTVAKSHEIKMNEIGNLENPFKKPSSRYIFYFEEGEFEKEVRKTLDLLGKDNCIFTFCGTLEDIQKTKSLFEAYGKTVENINNSDIYEILIDNEIETDVESISYKLKYVNDQLFLYIEISFYDSVESIVFLATGAFDSKEREIENFKWLRKRRKDGKLPIDVMESDADNMEKIKSVMEVVERLKYDQVGTSMATIPLRDNNFYFSHYDAVKISLTKFFVELSFMTVINMCIDYCKK